MFSSPRAARKTGPAQPRPFPSLLSGRRACATAAVCATGQHARGIPKHNSAPEPSDDCSRRSSRAADLPGLSDGDLVAVRPVDKAISAATAVGVYPIAPILPGAQLAIPPIELDVEAAHCHALGHPLRRARCGILCASYSVVHNHHVSGAVRQSDFPPSKMVRTHCTARQCVRIRRIAADSIEHLNVRVPGHTTHTQHRRVHGIRAHTVVSDAQACAGSRTSNGSCACSA